VVGLPVFLDRLEQHERIPAAVAQLVLREIRGNGINPGRKLLRLVEAGEMTMHANEDFLHQVFSALPVTDGPIDEVEQPALIAIDQLLKRLRIAIQMAATIPESS